MTVRHRGSRRGALVSLVSLVSLVALGACGSALVGHGVPQQPSPSAFGGERQDLTGTVRVQDNACVMVDLGTEGLRWVVWPDTAEESEDGGVVVGGVTVSDGVRVSGRGYVGDASVLPDWEERHSAFGSFGRYCGADDHGVVVFDEATLDAE